MLAIGIFIAIIIILTIIIIVTNRIFITLMYSYCIYNNDFGL